MSYGYSSPGPDISAWATEFDQAQDAWLEQQKAAEEAAAAKYAAAVESAKIGDGFCALAAEQPLPFAGCWLPIFQTWQERLAPPKSAELSAYDFGAILPRSEVAARMVSAGEDPAWCAAWAERGYVGRANVPGGTNAAYRAFNEQAESLLNAPAEVAAPAPAPDQKFTLADLAGLATKKKGRK